MKLMTTDANDAGPSRCDRLNAQFMRWRLRKDFGEAGLDEEERLMERIAQLGEIPPSGGTPVPKHAQDEDFASAIVLDLVRAWRELRLHQFTETYLRNAVRDFIKAQHWQQRNMKSLEPTQDFEETTELDSFDTADELSALLKRSDLLKLLNPEEAYLLGWFLANGKEQGEQGKAAAALGKPPYWASRVMKRLQEKATRLREQRSP